MNYEAFKYCIRVTLHTYFRQVLYEHLRKTNARVLFFSFSFWFFPDLPSLVN